MLAQIHKNFQSYCNHDVKTAISTSCQHRGPIQNFRDVIRGTRECQKHGNPFFVTATDIKEIHLSTDLKELLQLAGVKIVMNNSNSSQERFGILPQNPRIVHAHHRAFAINIRQLLRILQHGRYAYEAYEVVWKTTLGRGLKPSTNQPSKRKKHEEREMKLIDAYPLNGQMA